MMDPRVLNMMHQLLGPNPSPEVRALVLRLVLNLPPEILGSPAAVADIVLRADMLCELKSEITRFSWQEQQRIHKGLPDRIDAAALGAINKMRDYLPIDTKDSLNRLLKTAFVWTAFVLFIGASAGWMLNSYSSKRAATSNQAGAEREFNVCIYAAEGHAMSVGSSVNALRYDSAVYRTQARACAAEFADRRASS